MTATEAGGWELAMLELPRSRRERVEASGIDVIVTPTQRSRRPRSATP